MPKGFFTQRELNQPVYWRGSPTRCDICGTRHIATFIDGKTDRGPWGILCIACHASHGVGLGTGRGQRYERQADGRYLKVAG